MKTQEEIQQLSEKDFNNRQSAGHYELADLKSRDYYCDGFSNGYTQCQEDMADKKYTEDDLKKAMNYASQITNNKMKYIEDYINSLNKQD